MNNKHIVFDVDRTMINSYEPELLSLEEAIYNVTKRKLTRDEIKEASVLPTKVFFDKIGLTNIEDLIYKEWIITFRKYSVTCFPGIKELIKSIKSRGYSISIITSRTIEEFNELNDELKDIINLFSLIVTSDLVNNHKPSSDSMDYLINKLGLKKEDIIYIGDSIIDRDFAKGSGVKFIAACWDSKELINEDNVAFNPMDILNMI